MVAFTPLRSPVRPLASLICVTTRIWPPLGITSEPSKFTVCVKLAVTAGVIVIGAYVSWYSKSLEDWLEPPS